MSNFDFWATKHAIDDEVARLGWNREKCIVYIKQRYNARSRLSMTDEQLVHLLNHLKSLPTKENTATSFRSRKRERKRRHF
ncbi:MAG: hypothetical protein ACRDBG_09920 [Waterburya sp.]